MQTIQQENMLRVPLALLLGSLVRCK